MAVCLLVLVPVLAQAPGAELRRIEQAIEALQGIKQRLNELESEVDGLLRTLSEQRGQIQAQPPAFGAPAPVAPLVQPDKPIPVQRCAALTKDGSRCTRPALPGGRYCKQHAFAKQK